MGYYFTATIGLAGINPCVPVPFRITKKMTPKKGYIPVKCKIKNDFFTQTLVPVKGAEYRLYVNGIMLKRGQMSVGDRVRFFIEEDTVPRTIDQMAVPAAFAGKLKEKGFHAAFKALTEYRQKEILKYLNSLKTKEALLRNIAKVSEQLKVTKLATKRLNNIP
jgi:hypothetical protein